MTFKNYYCKVILYIDIYLYSYAYTFRPKINTKSVEIWNIMEKSSSYKRFDELAQEKSSWKMRDKKLKQMNDQELLNEWSFKPRTIGIIPLPSL